MLIKNTNITTSPLGMDKYSYDVFTILMGEIQAFTVQVPLIIVKE